MTAFWNFSGMRFANIGNISIFSQTFTETFFLNIKFAQENNQPHASIQQRIHTKAGPGNPYGTTIRPYNAFIFQHLPDTNLKTI
jgi:hypothetical protein